MTAPDIAETVRRIRELAAKATPGPWAVDRKAGNRTVRIIVECREFNGIARINAGVLRLQNAAYIAAANPQAILAILAELERVTVERDAAQRQYALHVQLWTDADKRAETAEVRILDLEEFQIDLANSSRTQRERAEAAEAAVDDWAARYRAINEEYALARRLLCERTAEVARLEADLIVAKTMRAVVETQLTETSRDGHEAFEEDMK